ncbi:MAG: VTT domain-containing protein [Sphaerochaetaceae bacterium]|nr:VTT domain-containing protein [Sphaerochaetaceae bacterium]
MVKKIPVKKILTVALWAAAAVFLFINRSNITPEKIASFLPGASFLSALAILVLFAIKSVTFVVYAGILYATTALIFPVGWALVINVLGTAVAVSLPYLIGRAKGHDTIVNIENKYPKLKNNPLLSGEHEFTLILILRLAKILPYDVVSLYLGAKRVKYYRFLPISVICMTDNIVLLTILGTSFMTSNLPLAVTAAVIEVTIIALSMLWVWYYTKKMNKKDEKMSVYDFTVKDRKGIDVNLSEYKGKVLLIVNTATGCGFTPQYEALEALYADHREEGFEILDFPCNQFGHQAPGSDDEIHEFCTMKFGTKFPQFSKIDVNGENASPLFKYLTANTKFEGMGEGERAAFMEQYLAKLDPDFKNNSKIKWNFTKFLINRNGEIVKRFEPTCEMETVRKEVEAVL